MHRFSDERRRARLGRRHALRQRVPTVEEAVDAVVCLHATEPPTPYLSVAARTDCTVADVDRALFETRSVVKQLAMRRTLFAFPRRLLPAVRGSASARVLAQVGPRMAKEVQAAGITEDGTTWVAEVVGQVIDTLVEHGPRTTAELRALLPLLEHRLDLAPGKSYGANVAVASRLLTVVAAGGEVVRGENVGDWRVSRPRWTPTAAWTGEPVEALPPEEGYAALVAAWLGRFGPGTEADLVWWLGATKAAVRRALADVGAVEVSLDGGASGFLLPDDVDAAQDEDDAEEPEPWAALLPVLDATVMGWKDRSFYLDPSLVGSVFDTNGNAGTSAWWCGRVVGCWVQDPDGVVELVYADSIPDPGREARAALAVEAERLTAWLGGVQVPTIYRSPLMRSADEAARRRRT